VDEKYTKKKKNDELQVAGWEVIYCSLALILVAFFAMLVSYSSVEEKRMKTFLRGFSSESATSLQEGLSTSTVLRKGMVSTGGNEGLRSGGSDGISGGKVKRPSHDIIADDKSVMAAMNSIKTIIELGGDEEDVSIVRTERGFKATLGSNVLFPSGVAALKSQSHRYLNEMIAIVDKGPFMVRVEGHTDNVPIHTASFSSNWELSTARAITVLRYILANSTVFKDRIAAVGFSEYHPIAPNETSEGRKKNRRVEIYFEQIHEVQQ